MTILEIENLSASYGHALALKGISLHIAEGELVAVLGANGAGKSTLMRLISGLIRPTTGEVRFEGLPISQRSPESIARLGIAHVPEGRHLFPGLSVRDNIVLGASPASRGIPHRARVKRRFDDVISTFPMLTAMLDTPAWQLSGGQQQMVALARGVMCRPRLLLLDEPSLGLAPVFVRQVFDVLAQMRGETTILLVEQNANTALDVSDRAYVMETGRVVLDGPSADLNGSESLRAAYFGGNASQEASIKEMGDRTT